jgi:hypothetical protein
VDTYCEGSPIVTAICETATKDDPPLIFGWRNVRAFVESIPHVNMFPPFALPQNPTEDQFKAALMNFVRMPGSSPPQGLFVLPCTIHEITQVCGDLALLDKDPWFIAVAARNPHAVPLASLVAPVPRGNTVRVSYVSRSDAPCRLWGAL